MALLIANISNDSRNVRCAHAKCSIPFLPCELSFHFTHPFGRICLDKENSPCQRKLGWKLYQTMDVIFHPANCVHEDIFFPADACDVRPHPWLDILGNHLAALSCAEHDVNYVLGKCLGHVSPLRGS